MFSVTMMAASTRRPTARAMALGGGAGRRCRRVVRREEVLVLAHVLPLSERLVTCAGPAAPAQAPRVGIPQIGRLSLPSLADFVRRPELFRDFVTGLMPQQAA